MSCAYSRETLALFVEDDLAAGQADGVRAHVSRCESCRQTCEQLQASQSLIRSALKPSFSGAVRSEVLAAVRDRVLSQIDDAPKTFGWKWRIERALVLSFRRHAYACAGVAVLLILSASLLGEIRHGSSEMVRPDGYRGWVLVGSTEREGARNNVYISPAAFQQYSKTGIFPEGTVMVLEGMRAGEKDPIQLQASVKDSGRFEGGWGFYEFGDRASRAASNGSCRSCHEERGKTDHVFTQFYPVLRSAVAGAVYDRADFPGSVKDVRS